MAVDCKECRKACFKTDIKSLVKGEAFIFSILLVIVALGMALTRISQYDTTRPGIFHKLPYDVQFQPNGLLGILHYCFNISNYKIGDIVRNLSITKEGKGKNKIFSVLVGLFGAVSIVGVLFYQVFTVINLFMGRVNGTQPKIPSYWPLYFLTGFIFVIILLAFLGYIFSLIPYLLSTPEFFLATILVVSSMVLYFFVPHYPYMPAGLSGGGLIGVLLLGGK